MFKTNISGQNKIWGTKRIWGALPPDVPPWLRAWEQLCCTGRLQHMQSIILSE